MNLGLLTVDMCFVDLLHRGVPVTTYSCSRQGLIAVRQRYRSFKNIYSVGSIFITSVTVNVFEKYSRTEFIRYNWDGKTSGYAENPDNLIFL
jgi:hypothetical protein